MTVGGPNLVPYLRICLLFIQSFESQNSCHCNSPHFWWDTICRLWLIPPATTTRITQTCNPIVSLLLLHFLWFPTSGFQQYSNCVPVLICPAIAVQNNRNLPLLACLLLTLITFSSLVENASFGIVRNGGKSKQCIQTITREVITNQLEAKDNGGNPFTTCISRWTFTTAKKVHNN